MLSLAQAIRTFQHGALSPVEFFAQIERVLATDQGNSGHLLAILDEEHTNFPLPPDVYVEVKRRIESMDQPKKKSDADETRVLTNHQGKLPQGTIERSFEAQPETCASWRPPTASPTSPSKF
jgi:hypothetical protein